MKIILMSLTLVFLLLTGCARLNSSKSDRFNPYVKEDLDELLHFGANMANMTASSRAEVCRSLLARQKETAGAGIQLHLMTGRLLSDACGDIGKILDGVDSKPMRTLSDERVRWLVDAQTEALKRMGNLSRKLGSVEYRPKTVQCATEPKKGKAESKKGVAEPQKGDSNLLRDKLEAIRSMEKKLDETGDGN
jgi:hypothetical protein